MADPRIAIAITLKNEGGFQKDPNDRANWTGGKVGYGTLVGTKYGITTPEEDAINYYSNHYWKIYYSQINDQSIANKLFDLGVLFGIPVAVMALQHVLEVVADGIFGEATLLAANYANAALLLSEFKDAMSRHATNIAAANANETGFLPGWIRRINS
jgi:lysozyme family protein